MVTINFESDSISYILLVLYIPPTAQMAALTFLESLHNCLESLAKHSPRILVAEHFNMDKSIDDESSRQITTFG